MEELAIQAVKRDSNTTSTRDEILIMRMEVWDHMKHCPASSIECAHQLRELRLLHLHVATNTPNQN